jgi:PAP2 superfamily
VSILATITFLLVPTAPPWLASEHGLIPQVQPIIKNALFDLDLNALALRKGDSSSYNVVAAVPSLHVAWPVIALLVIRKHGLPRGLLAAQAALTVGVVFAIVYTGEHYLVDAIIGALYALVAWWLVQWAVGARRRTRAPLATESS